MANAVLSTKYLMGFSKSPLKANVADQSAQYFTAECGHFVFFTGLHLYCKSVVENISRYYENNYYYTRVIIQ